MQNYKIHLSVASYEIARESEARYTVRKRLRLARLLVNGTPRVMPQTD